MKIELSGGVGRDYQKSASSKEKDRLRSWGVLPFFSLLRASHNRSRLSCLCYLLWQYRHVKSMMSLYYLYTEQRLSSLRAEIRI